MSLRRRTLHILGSTGICALLLMLLISHFIILNRFLRLEDAYLRADLARVTSAFDDELSRLDAIAGDWAPWDDTYAFIQDANQAYIDSNLVDSTFETLSINLMLFADLQGRVVYSGAFDLASREQAPIPTGLQEHLSPTGVVLVDRTDEGIAGATGIIALPDGLLLLASRPILTSMREGPSRGTLVIGRFLDDAEVAHLAGITHLPLTVIPVADTAGRAGGTPPPADLDRALKALSPQTPTFTYPLDGRTIIGYVLRQDLYGRPAAVLRLALPRDIYAQGQMTERYLLLALLLLGVPMAVVMTLWMDRRVTSRLTTLSQEIERIGDNQNLGQRVSPLPGHDELSVLAASINTTLDRLESARAERQRAAEALRKSEENYHQLFEDCPISLWEENFAAVKVDLDDLRAAGVTDLRAYLAEHPEAACRLAALVRVMDVNRATLRLYGAQSKEQLLAGISRILDPATASEVFVGQLIAIASGKLLFEGEGVNATLSGETRNITLRWSVVSGYEQTLSKVLVSITDITDHKRLEAHLLQAQKMEAIGRLAGGVAHDFNNLLTVINGYGQMVLDELDPKAPFHPEISEIVNAGRRAAVLTRQLLAFSRRQMPEVCVVNLNQVLQGMETLLMRIIREDIRLQIVRAPELDNVRTDPGHIEQVVLNLVVNARDAMPSGGILTVETANVILDEEYASSHPEARAGRYVQLVVRDTGIGMSPETREHLYEPFFTTKEVGQGTGLGLATIYGIVKQSGGTIDVESAPGQGTTFRVYLPSVEVAEAAEEPGV